MSIKLFHELNRAAESEDDEALKIFRALSQQLKNGGLSWIDIPDKLATSKITPGKPSTAPNRRIHRPEYARKNIGPWLLKLRTKYRFLDQHTPNVQDKMWKWRKLEKDWLLNGYLTLAQVIELSQAIEFTGIEEYAGRAKPQWLVEHKKCVEPKKTEETRELQNCLVALQDTRSNILARTRKTMTDFVTTANSDRRRMIGWATISEIISEINQKTTKQDMSTLLDASQQSADTPGSMSLCILLDIPPARLNITTPGLSLASVYLSQHQHQTMDEFLELQAQSELDSAFEKYKVNSRVAACMSMLSDFDHS